jgi:hypothetical protein
MRAYSPDQVNPIGGNRSCLVQKTVQMVSVALMSSFQQLLGQSIFQTVYAIEADTPVREREVAGI